MSTQKNILYLYTEAMGYTKIVIDQLVVLGYEIHLVHWDARRLTSYNFPLTRGVKLYKRSLFGNKELKSLALDINPCLCVVSGWQDKAYLPVAYLLRKKGIPVVTCFDQNFDGTLKQHIGSGFSAIGLLKLFFTHAWVSGPSQFHYALKFGFNRENIIMDLLSADTSLFRPAIAPKKSGNNFELIYVGRLEQVKGFAILVAAWRKFIARFPDEARLTVIGDGSMRSLLNDCPQTDWLGFLDSSEIVDRLNASDCAVVPSLYEPWGVVVHEHASCGLPLILSDDVGSRHVFFIEGFNGFSFKSGDIDSLSLAIERVYLLSLKERRSFSISSQNLAQRISPLSSAMNLLSLLK